MDRKNPVNGLEFNQQLASYDEVRPVRARQV
jgi:hypothetical protein